MPQDYLAKLHELCRELGILWVSDEVQSGVGRTGTMWAVEQYAGAEPDMTVFGKSIGGGLPLAGVTGGAEVMDAVPPGGLGGTFGGNPLSCAAALAVLDVVTEPEFLAQARELGVTLRARLDDIASHDAAIGEVRGLGSMLAFEFAERTPDRAKAVVDAAFERGLILLSCGLYGNVIRLLPPLNIAPDELDEGLAILEESLGA
jgi:4-aminobutyrate aminotransferase-like enzyme